MFTFQHIKSHFSKEMICTFQHIKKVFSKQQSCHSNTLNNYLRGAGVVVSAWDSQLGDPGSIPTKTTSVENSYLLNAPWEMLIVRSPESSAELSTSGGIVVQ